MEYKDIVRDIKVAIKDVNESIVLCRQIKNALKKEASALREELRKHMNKAFTFAVPEQPGRGDLERAIGKVVALVDNEQRKKLALRPDARHLMLAYAFIRGRVYKDVERSCKEEPSADLIWSAMPGVGQIKEPSIHKAYIAQWLKGEFVMTKPERTLPDAAVA